MHWNGTLFESGTVTETGAGSWQRWPIYPVQRARLLVEVFSMTGDETNTVTLEGAWDDSGTASFDVQAWPQATSGSSLLVKILNQSTQIPIPEYWRFSYVIGGSTPSMSFTVYATLGAF